MEKSIEMVLEDVLESSSTLKNLLKGSINYDIYYKKIANEIMASKEMTTFIKKLYSFWSAKEKNETKRGD